MRILLAGNPNAGKTALFNRLTGENARVGNYPGVTVECRSGRLRQELVREALQQAGCSPEHLFPVSTERTGNLGKQGGDFGVGSPAEHLLSETSERPGRRGALCGETSCRGAFCAGIPSGDISHRGAYCPGNPSRDAPRRDAFCPGIPSGDASCLGTSFPATSCGGDCLTRGRRRRKSLCTPEILDLPGVYSLRPFSEEERVALSELGGGRADCVIHVADATCPARSLYLTLQLVGQGIPVVLALNRIDALRAGGGRADAAWLERLLGIPVVPVSAQTGEGVDALVLAVFRAAGGGGKSSVVRGTADASGGSSADKTACAVGESADRIACAASGSADGRTCALDGSDDLEKPCASDLPTDDRYGILAHAARLQAEGTDADTALAAARYAFVDRLCREAFSPMREDSARRRTRRLDRILTGRPFAYPAFFAILATVFALTFPLCGSWLQTGLTALTERFSAFLDGRLSALDVSLAGTQAGAVTVVLHSFLIGGLLRGVGSVLSFLPVILLLFFFLAVLEDSGYLARAAYLFDRPLRRAGLSGRSAVPILLGFGCTVPALLSVRTLPTSDGRRRTAFFLPFVSCSAKLTVFVTVSAAFFPTAPALLDLYAGGIAVGIVSLLVYRATTRRGEEEPFLLELPDYRMPRARQVFRLLWEKAADFVGRVFSVILFLSAAVWFLSSFDGSFHLTGDVGESLLAAVCRRLLPLFRPLGFTDWRIPAALFCGLFAKEAVVSTLSSLGASVSEIFSPATAAAFLSFVLFYPPCAAAEGCTARESGRGAAIGQFLLRTAVAYVAAGVVVRLF